MVDSQLQTLGDILCTRKFFLHLFCFSNALFNIIVIYKNGFWIGLHMYDSQAAKGLLMAYHVALFASVIITLSWILVDDPPWLGKSIILLSVGLLLTGYGTYFTIGFLNYGNDFCRTEFNHYVPRDWNGRHCIWLPLLSCLNLIQGLCTILLSVYVCLIWDY